MTCDSGSAAMARAYDEMAERRAPAAIQPWKLDELLDRRRATIVPGGMALVCVWGGASTDGTTVSAGAILRLMRRRGVRAIAMPGFENIDVRIRTESGRGDSHHPQVMGLRRTV